MKHKIIVIAAIVVLLAAVGVGTVYLLRDFLPKNAVASLADRTDFQKQAVVLEIEANTAIKNGDWAKATDKLTQAKKLYTQAGDKQSVKRVELRLEPVKNGKPPKPNGISRMEQSDPIVDTLK